VPEWIRAQRSPPCQGTTATCRAMTEHAPTFRFQREREACQAPSAPPGSQIPGLASQTYEVQTAREEGGPHMHMGPTLGSVDNQDGTLHVQKSTKQGVVSYASEARDEALHRPVPRRLLLEL
jgi:hypothetical protein